MRGALEKIKKLQGQQGRIVQKLYDKEERLEELAAEMDELEVETTADRAEHARLQSDIKAMELWPKKATVSADGLLPMLRLWYDAYKADSVGGVAEASVDAAFNGIATWLGQLGQHRAAVKNEAAVSPPALLAEAPAAPTNSEDFIAAAAIAANAAPPAMAAVVATPIPEEKCEGVQGDGQETVGGSAARESQPKVPLKPIRQQTP